jgi:hypothetical protein
LNDEFRLPYLPELIESKLSGPEKQAIEEERLAFHERERERLTNLLEETYAESSLPERPSAFEALDDLLKRLRLRRVFESPA